MRTREKIETYKAKIQKLVSANVALTPDQLLRQLLEEQAASDSSMSFAMFQRSSIPHELIASLRDVCVDMVSAVNSYMENHAIDKDSDFYALIVAYFYYYEDCYTSEKLLDNRGLYQQVLNPLHLYRQEIEKNTIDALFDMVNSEDELVRKSVCGALVRIGVSSAAMHARVFSKLCGVMKFEYVNSVKLAALSSLSSIDCSNIRIDHVIDDLISLENMQNVRSIENACQLLTVLPIPMDQQAAVIDRMFELIEHTDSASAYEVLRRLSVPTEKLAGLIDRLLNNVDSHDEGVSTAAWLRLSYLTIPIDRQGELVTKFINQCHGPARILFNDVWRSVCRLAGSLADQHLERIIDTAIDILNDTQNRKQSRLEVLNFLDSVNVPASHHVNVYEIVKLIKSGGALCDANVVHVLFHRFCRSESERQAHIEELFIKLDHLSASDVLEACGILRRFNLNDVQRSVMVSACLRIIATNTPIGLIAFSQLKEIDIPEDMREHVVRQMLAVIDASSKKPLSPYTVLASMQIPESMHEAVIKRMLCHIDSHGAHRYACDVIVNMSHSMSQSAIANLVIRLELIRDQLQRESARPMLLSLIQNLQLRNTAAAMLLSLLPSELVGEVGVRYKIN